MSFYLELHKASHILRSPSGYPYSWRSGPTVAVFKNNTEFTSYVKANADDLADIVAFSGSASLIDLCNSFIADTLRARGVL